MRSICSINMKFENKIYQSYTYLSSSHGDKKVNDMKEKKAIDLVSC